MNCLRSVGLAFRIRALVLFVSFAIGSLLARDALLVQQTLMLRAQVALEAVDADDETSDLPAFEELAATRTIKVRPSGMSRRTAMNPWDPPDDDDELDQDSDTIAAAYSTLAVLPAVCGDFVAPASVTAVVPPTTLAASTASDECAGIWSRGPPV